MALIFLKIRFQRLVAAERIKLNGQEFGLQTQSSRAQNETAHQNSDVPGGAFPTQRPAQVWIRLNVQNLIQATNWTAC